MTRNYDDFWELYQRILKLLWSQYNAPDQFKKAHTLFVQAQRICRNPELTLRNQLKFLILERRYRELKLEIILTQGG